MLSDVRIIILHGPDTMRESARRQDAKILVTADDPCCAVQNDDARRSNVDVLAAVQLSASRWTMYVAGALRMDDAN